jgi:Mn-dependent transcriptional regulator
MLGEEQSNSVLLLSLEPEIKVSSSFLLGAVEELEKEGLIQSREKLVGLTKRGRKEAEEIVKKHVFIEDYFRRQRSEEEAHKAAHILEHYISQEVIDNVKKLSTFKMEGIPLTKFDLNEEGIITNITFSDFTLFERIISMGIFPGEKIRITNVTSGSVIVGIGSKKFALGGEVAQGIEALKGEET